MSASAVWFTRANGLTFLRLLAVPILVLAICRDAAEAATAVFFLAVASDFADGWAARRWGEASTLGGLMDHAVDATFVTAGCAALAYRGALPAALPLLIPVAFLQYAFDARSPVARGLRASSLGRWNGIAYYVAVAVPLVRDTLGLPWPGPNLVRLLAWALVLSTLLSITQRLRGRVGEMH